MKINLENKQDLGASTLRHITYMKNQVKEKYREYNTPLCIAFVEYSVQTQAILTSLKEQGIEDEYIQILKDIYTDSSVTVNLHKESEKIMIKRGVRRGTPSHPSCSRQHWRAYLEG